ncbi:MAG TPA: gliding motility-associated C-terminal domain-containing protein, partial [Saprospiraceae bacterium]|nr:gliding motility-associated C-terminal domain-containing protein [Saprospiraceae bacterium]
CKVSDYFEFEVYNANEGTANNVVASVKLPPGLKIVAGSSQIAYPTGSGWVNLPDPVLVNGTLQWNPSAVIAALATAGLVGVSKDPDNSFSIRFRVEATCGFVSNSQIVYGAESVQSCGALSNVLRKPGAPVQLEGVSPSYQVQSQLSFTNPPGAAACGQSVSLTATLIMGDAPSPGDSIYILLPAGTSFVSGSYKPVQNAPSGPPQATGQTLQLPLSGVAGIGTVMRFTFEVRYDNPANCDDKIVVLQTREKEALFCPSQNTNCSVYVATGETLLTLNTQNPDLLLKDFQPVANGSGFNFTGVLQNQGSGTAQNEVIKFYLDQNGNGKVDAGEPLVTEAKFNQVIAGGNSTAVTGSLGSLSASDICKLIAFIPGPDNCACSDRTIPLGGTPTVTTPVASCTVQPLSFGTPTEAGHNYTWVTPNGLSCTDCSSTTFTPGPNVEPGDVLTFVLLDKVGDCTIERRFELKYGAPSGIETPDQIICEGESATLNASTGGSYQWSGPGITNPNNATQVVSPNSTATYSVTVTFPGGCTGTGQSLVTVLPVDTTFLPDLKTCKGDAVVVFGNLTDVEGTYIINPTSSTGCDSVVVQRLFVTPTDSLDNRALCPGDTIVLFGKKVGKAGTYCEVIPGGPGGCDINYCVVVKSVPNPTLTQPDTVIIPKGTGTVLVGPPNLANYVWTPTSTLTCSDCPSPTATPDTSTTYTLKVKDGNGCGGQVTYRVRVFPPCDPERLDIPNAFTPNGDQVNGLFRVVPYEGFESVYSLAVYDRWGRKVFEKFGTGALEWDGTVDGKPGQADVYAYVITVDCPNAGRVVRKGDVTLIR